MLQHHSIAQLSHVLQLPSGRVAEFQRKTLSIIAPEAAAAAGTLNSDFRDLLNTNKIPEAAFEEARILTLQDARDTFDSLSIVELRETLKLSVPHIGRLKKALGLVPAAAVAVFSDSEHHELEY